MKCVEFMSLLPRYPDDITGDERDAFLAHAAECPECGAMLAEQEAMLAELVQMDDDLDVPEAFSTGWRALVHAEAKPVKKPWYSHIGTWATAAAALVVIIGGTALMRGGYIFPEAKQQDTLARSAPQAVQVMGEAAPATGMALKSFADTAVYDEMETGAAYDDYEAEEAQADNGSGGVQQPVILYSASVSLDSSDYDGDLAHIQQLLEGRGGWIEYQSSRGEALSANPEAGRYAYIRLRVPTAEMEAFIGSVRDIGKVTGVETTAEDVSSSYYDTQSRLEMYTAQRDRLLELYASAEDMSDIIEIEARLSELQYTIESLTGRIKTWDQRAESAVVTISVTEVAPEGTHARQPLSQRLADTARNSWLSVRAFGADVLVFLVMAAPYLLILAVLVGAALGILYIGKRKKKK